MTGPGDLQIGPNEAADAIIVAIDNRGNPHVALVGRADIPKEAQGRFGRWAVPGGFRDPQDKTSLDVAVREAREEIGLNLAGKAGVRSVFARVFSGAVHDPRNTDQAWDGNYRPSNSFDPKKIRDLGIPVDDSGLPVLRIRDKNQKGGGEVKVAEWFNFKSIPELEQHLRTRDNLEPGDRVLFADHMLLLQNAHGAMVLHPGFTGQPTLPEIMSWRSSPQIATLGIRRKDIVRG